MGWRYLLFTIGGITTGVFLLRFVLFRFQESPKFHVYRGHDDKAVQVLHPVRHYNGQKPSMTLEMLEGSTNEQESMGSGAALLGGGTKPLKKTFRKMLLLELTGTKSFSLRPGPKVVKGSLGVHYRSGNDLV